MLESLDEFQRQAFEIIIAGDKARNAFDLSKEDEATLPLWQRLGAAGLPVLARRLVEAGVNFVTVGVPGDSIIYNWMTMRTRSADGHAAAAAELRPSGHGI